MLSPVRHRRGSCSYSIYPSPRCSIGAVNARRALALGGPRAFYARIFTAIDSEASSEANGKLIVQFVKQLNRLHGS